jgi:hypothetical protein
MANELLEAALSYAARGWRVHPLKPGEKVPILPKWPERATTDPEIIRAWWEKRPTANVGIACGGPANLLVLDVDGPEGVEALAGRHLPPTVTARTPRGGLHYLFTYSGSEPIGNSAGRLGPKLDTRGTGGYVVAAPSTNGNGGAYAWVLPPGEVDLEPAPRWLVDALTNGAASGGLVVTAREGVADKLQRLDTIPPGTRHDMFLGMAGDLRRRGYQPEEIRATLHASNALRCSPPHDPADLDRIAHDIGAKPAGRELVPATAEAQPLRDIAELLALDIPPVVPLVGDAEGVVLEAGALTIAHGKPRSWKSWSALLLGLSVASGRHWLGRFPTQRSRVAFVQEEGGLGRWVERIRLACGAVGVNPQDLAGWFRTDASRGFRLDDDEQLDQLLVELADFKPGLVVLDPLSSLHGGDENETRAASDVVRRLRRIQREVETAVLVIHHDRKSGLADAPRRGEAIRGSSALWAAGSTIGFTRTPSHGALVEIEQKDAAAPGDFEVHFDFTSEGLEVTTDTSVPTGHTIECGQAILDTLVERLMLSQIVTATGYPRSTVQRALDDLQARRRVAVVGTGSRGAHIYARVGGGDL